MAITLGTLSFDEAHTTVHEKYEEVGGRDGRLIVLSGLLVGDPTADAIEARLDAILVAATAEESAALSLRPGRRLWVRRTAFARDVKPGAEASSPVAPNPDTDCIALATLYLRPGMTCIKSTNDGINGYITDTRDLL